MENVYGEKAYRENTYVDTSGVVYQMPCKDCPKVYTGETGRQFGIRKKEHRKDVDSVGNKKFTWARRK